MPRLVMPAVLVAVLLCCGPVFAALTSAELDRAAAWLAESADRRAPIDTLQLPNDLSQAEAEEATRQLWAQFTAQPPGDNPLGTMPERVGNPQRPELVVQTLELGKHRMPFVVLRREQATPPSAGRALFLCLHGGGQNANAEGAHDWAVNSREFQAQAGLARRVYPADGIYWIPRMADDRLGRWWHPHNLQAFEQVIDHAVVHWDVDPNRVYLQGVSEGGYAAAVLTPFMPDRFAGAAAMAAGVGLGNPAENLRNVAFRTDVGERDTMFDRQPLAMAFHQRLDQLHEQDPDGYVHSINVQPGRGHGVDYRPGPEWISKHRRTPFPSKVVWIDIELEGMRRHRCYWLALEPQERNGRRRLVAEVERADNTISLTAERLLGEQPTGYPTHLEAGDLSAAEPMSGERVTLLLSDELVNLDRPVRVVVNGQAQPPVRPSRSAADILASLAERPDPATVAACRVEMVVE